MLAPVACKHRAAVVRTGEAPVSTEAQRPAWVQARPVSAGDYIGIGLCPKTRPDYQESAKKNALNDLASEISVKVEGNSLLYTLDRKYAFDEQFTSTINTRTSEQLEGYELVDTYENAGEYWTYYRLSKAEHARIKAEKKARAIGQATDGYGRAQQSLAAGDLKGAFDQDLRALIVMKDYWGENDQVTLNGRQVPLANEVFNDLQRLTSGVRLSALPERCGLNYGNRFKREMLVSAAYAGGGSPRALAQLPLVLSYPGAGGKVTEMKHTDAEGRIRGTVQRVDPDAPAPELLIRLDVDALVSKDLDPTFTRPLIGSLTVPELHVPMDREMPRVFLRGDLTNMGQPVPDAAPALGLKEELTRRGFRFVERASDADLLLDLKASTREGGEASGFYTAYLDVSFSFKDRRTGDTIYEGGRQGVKGIQLTYAKAGLDAYKKADQDLRQELVPAMLNALL
ncbi:MAG: LPP20 family lipoprotein [Flavobacteriales bacterium]